MEPLTVRLPPLRTHSVPSAREQAQQQQHAAARQQQGPLDGCTRTSRLDGIQHHQQHQQAQQQPLYSSSSSKQAPVSPEQRQHMLERVTTLERDRRMSGDCRLAEIQDQQHERLQQAYLQLQQRVVGPGKTPTRLQLLMLGATRIGRLQQSLVARDGSQTRLPWRQLPPHVPLLQAHEREARLQQLVQLERQRLEGGAARPCRSAWQQQQRAEQQRAEQQRAEQQRHQQPQQLPAGYSLHRDRVHRLSAIVQEDLEDPLSAHNAPALLVQESGVRQWLSATSEVDPQRCRSLHAHPDSAHSGGSEGEEEDHPWPAVARRATSDASSNHSSFGGRSIHRNGSSVASSADHSDAPLVSRVATLQKLFDGQQPAGGRHSLMPMVEETGEAVAGDEATTGSPLPAAPAYGSRKHRYGGKPVSVTVTAVAGSGSTSSGSPLMQPSEGVGEDSSCIQDDCNHNIGSDADACMLCCVNPREVVFLHQSAVHRCICRDCAVRIKVGYPCPQCKAPILGILRVYSAAPADSTDEAAAASTCTGICA